MSSVLAIDPGGTIGLAWGSLDLAEKWDPSKVHWAEIPMKKSMVILGFDREVASVYQVLLKAREIEATVIVCESFALTPGRILKGPALLPVSQEGMLRFALQNKWWNGTYLTQTPSNAKTTITDARLRQAEVWAVGQKHSRDALRHLLLFYRRLRSGKVKL
jgi:hypothetical protein